MDILLLTILNINTPSLYGRNVGLVFLTFYTLGPFVALGRHAVSTILAVLFWKLRTFVLQR